MPERGLPLSLMFQQLDGRFCPAYSTPFGVLNKLGLIQQLRDSASEHNKGFSGEKRFNRLFNSDSENGKGGSRDALFGMEAVHRLETFVFWRGLLFPYTCFQPSYNQSVTGVFALGEFSKLFDATKLLRECQCFQKES